MSKSNASTPTTADDSHEDFLDTKPPAPEKKKYTFQEYKLGPLKITRKKEVRAETGKKASLPARVVQKMFSCGGECAACVSDL